MKNEDKELRPPSARCSLVMEEDRTNQMLCLISIPRLGCGNEYPREGARSVLLNPLFTEPRSRQIDTCNSGLVLWPEVVENKCCA